MSILLSMTAPGGAELFHTIERLRPTGRVMYVAAHPDDENTHLLAYLTRGRHARAAYLSITRGDGGQNLIGSEQSPLMGVIRTHELARARRVDDAEQLFTRARDFGYSKSADEALERWGHEATLADVVRAVRTFRPHVIITRFPERGSTHGHHLASAILAREAFEAAGDPERFPEQLDELETWKPVRLLFNVSRRFMPDEVRDDDLVIDIGGLDPLSGKSFGELSAESRTQHKSQGFGTPRRWGPRPEHFRHLAGVPAEDGDILGGIDVSWSAQKGGSAFDAAIDALARAYNPAHPEDALPLAAKALTATADIADARLREHARRELYSFVLGASGMVVELRAERAHAVPGQPLEVTLEIDSRSNVPHRLNHASMFGTELAAGDETRVTVPVDTPPTILPWLPEWPDIRAQRARYAGHGPSEQPLPPAPVTADVGITVAGMEIPVSVAAQRVWTDRVHGEQRQAVTVVPALTLSPRRPMVLLRPGQPTRLVFDARLRGSKTRVELTTPPGIRARPAVLDIAASGPIEVELYADEANRGGPLTATIDGQRAFSEHTIDHRHIPRTTVLLPLQVGVDTAEIQVPSGRIGHIPGPGDRVADALEGIGVDIVEISPTELESGDLAKYSAILVGIRAFNTRPELQEHLPRLREYAENGGTVVVQYVTRSRRREMDIKVAPYDLEIGRGRVTDENAEVTVLADAHPVLMTPHDIGKADFDGWVHERGLYFGETWGEPFIPILAMADEGEPPLEGSLLIADVGKGRYVYTGLSFFRQLPAGVVGAYRLMINLLTPRSHDLSETEPADSPPILGSWKNLYLVLGWVLLTLVLFFYLLSQRFAP